MINIWNSLDYRIVRPTSDSLNIFESNPERVCVLAIDATGSTEAHPSSSEAAETASGEFPVSCKFSLSFNCFEINEYII